jgi:hypothetical protein
MVQDSVPSVNIGLTILTVTQVQEAGIYRGAFLNLPSPDKTILHADAYVVPAVNRSEARSVGR